jgi:hypothetical protein
VGYKRLTDNVDMTFSAMQWKGRSYKITAKASKFIPNFSPIFGPL